MNRTLALVVGLVSLCLAGPAVSGDNKNNSGKGLNKQAIQELEDAGVTKYTDKFWPDLAQDVGEGWTKYTYLPNAAKVRYVSQARRIRCSPKSTTQKNY